MGLRGEGYGTGGCRASPLGVRVMGLRGAGQDTAGCRLSLRDSPLGIHRHRGHGGAGYRARYCGVRVRVLRDDGQDTAGVGSSYCGGNGHPKGEAIGHTMGCWVSICGMGGEDGAN